MTLIFRAEAAEPEPLSERTLRHQRWQRTLKRTRQRQEAEQAAPAPETNPNETPTNDLS